MKEAANGGGLFDLSVKMDRSRASGAARKVQAGTVMEGCQFRPARRNGLWVEGHVLKDDSTRNSIKFFVGKVRGLVVHGPAPGCGDKLAVWVEQVC